MRDPEPVVYLVDDDAEVLKGLHRLLTAAGLDVRAFGSPREFLAQVDPHTPGCLVLDLAMPELDGLALHRALSERGSHMPVIFLTGRGDIRSSVQAMKGGAQDFLTKPVDHAELRDAIARALESVWAERRIRDDQAEFERRFATLTSREHEVLKHILAGRLNKQIAAELGTVERTIKFHRANVMRKTGVRSVAELVRLAEHAGIKPVQS